MKTMEQIARDMREGTFPGKSDATLREDRIAARPSGSNADEWHLFLSEHLDNRANYPNGLTYMAVQIAEAIDASSRAVKSSLLDWVVNEASRGLDEGCHQDSLTAIKWKIKDSAP